MTTKGDDSRKKVGNRKISPGEKRMREYMAGRMRNTNQAFHMGLKHVLGGVSLLSLLAAFEVFSIPAASGIIELFILTKLPAAEVWFGTAALTGFAALYLHREEQENDI